MLRQPNVFTKRPPIKGPVPEAIETIADHIPNILALFFSFGNDNTNKLSELGINKAAPTP